MKALSLIILTTLSIQLVSANDSFTKSSEQCQQAIVALINHSTDMGVEQGRIDKNNELINKNTARLNYVQDQEQIAVLYQAIKDLADDINSRQDYIDQGLEMEASLKSAVIDSCK